MRAEGLAVGALLAFVACSSTPPKQLVCPDPTPIYDGGEDEMSATAPCSRACKRLVSLGCPEGQPSSAGTTCYAVCRRAGDALDAECVASATSRAALAKCNVRCVP